jgi:hypothetical protein
MTQLGAFSISGRQVTIIPFQNDKKLLKQASFLHGNHVLSENLFTTLVEQDFSKMPLLAKPVSLTVQIIPASFGTSPGVTYPKKISPDSNSTEMETRIFRDTVQELLAVNKLGAILPIEFILRYGQGILEQIKDERKDMSILFKVPLLISEHGAHMFGMWCEPHKDLIIGRIRHDMQLPVKEVLIVSAIPS